MQYTPKSELFDSLRVVIALADKIDGNAVQSAQDAMINMRIDWEELQTRLKNRKFEGFEAVIQAMHQLTATTLVMTAALQAKVLTQRAMQLNWVAEEEKQEVKLEEKKRKAKKKKLLKV